MVCGHNVAIIVPGGANYIFEHTQIIRDSELESLIQNLANRKSHDGQNYKEDENISPCAFSIRMLRVFLAVHNSSIGLIVCPLLGHH